MLIDWLEKSINLKKDKKKWLNFLIKIFLLIWVFCDEENKIEVGDRLQITSRKNLFKKILSLQFKIITCL